MPTPRIQEETKSHAVLHMDLLKGTQGDHQLDLKGVPLPGIVSDGGYENSPLARSGKRVGPEEDLAVTPGL